MRPTLNILSDDLIANILDEAKRIMAETGMEIRGENLRQRLLDHGLKELTGHFVLPNCHSLPSNVSLLK